MDKQLVALGFALKKNLVENNKINLSQNYFSFVLYLYRVKKATKTKKATILFNGYYTKYYKEIYYFVLFNLKCKDDAADIVQETFSKLSLQEIEQIANVRAWLYRVANNLIVNKVAQRNLFLRFLSYAKSEDNHTFQLELFDEEYKLNILNKAILQLPDEQRKLILLYRDDFSYKEIAEIMKINLNSVGKKLSRAIDKLKTKVGENNELFE